MPKAICAVLVRIALVCIAAPAHSQLPDCSWKSKTQWARGEAQLVQPAGSVAGPIVADLIVRYDGRKALEDEATARDVVLKLSRPQSATAIAPTMSFPRASIRLVIDGTEAQRFVADGEGEREIGAAFKGGVTKAKSLEAFASFAADDKPMPLIRCSLTGSAEAIREMEAPARSFAIKEHFEKVRSEPARRDAANRVAVCREKANLVLTRIKWDYQDEFKACRADEQCIAAVTTKRDARAADGRRQLAACDDAGGGPGSP